MSLWRSANNCKCLPAYYCTPPLSLRDGCDGCNGCGNSGGGRVETIYQPYIDGKKELSQINEEYAASRGLIR